MHDHSKYYWVSIYTKLNANLWRTPLNPFCFLFPPGPLPGPQVGHLVSHLAQSFGGSQDVSPFPPSAQLPHLPRLIQDHVHRMLPGVSCRSTDTGTDEACWGDTGDGEGGWAMWLLGGWGCTCWSVRVFEPRFSLCHLRLDQSQRYSHGLHILRERDSWVSHRGAYTTVSERDWLNQSSQSFLD